MAIAAIERPLPNSNGLCNLVHTYSVNTALCEEALRDLQNALAMLRRVAPFMLTMRLEPLWYTRRTRKLTSFFFHSFSS
jgi:hypothetical protein